MKASNASDPDRRLLWQAVWLTLAVWGLDAGFNIMPRVVGGDLKATTVVSLTTLSATGLALSPAVYLAVARLRARNAATRYAGLTLASLAAGAGVAAVDLTLGGWLRHLVDPAFAEPVGTKLAVRAVSNLLAYGWMFGLVGALYMMVNASRALVEHERQLADARTRAAEAENQATAARLAALRYQLNPHFLFNTLNAVSSAVITKRNDEAESMLEKLAGFLRVTLAADPEALIPLEDELATIQAYLEIESVRFRDRLGVDFSCPDELRGAVVPSFILQPLIENAVKHGVSRASAAVTIRLEVARDGDDLVVLVEDDAERLGEPAKGAGVGLNNIRQRLGALYGARGVLQTTARERGFLALVRLPLIQSLKARKARAA
ncbi:sensor histidine kinase [Phenylobacterium sp.]|uniref:sensor histidine kinase n=1 Tax=Phenylobacterium sp. TaxID=1871053 RepID=UPI0025D9ECE8|nr:histidine kinase [Phenylobacterium sp.]